MKRSFLKRIRLFPHPKGGETRMPGKRILLLLLFLTLLPCSPASAALPSEFDVGGAGTALPREASEALGEWDIEDADVDTGIGRIVTYVREQFHVVLAEVLRPVLAVMAVTVLCAVGGGLSAGVKAGGFDYVSLAGCLSIGMVCVSDISSLVAMGRETMENLWDFSKALLPSLTAAGTAAGAVTAAPVKYAATALFLDVLINVADTLVFPLICAFLAVVLADAAIGEGRLSDAVKLLKWMCRLVMCALVSTFTLYLTVSGVVASAGDAVAEKAAKTVLSAALPVVGGIVSDAAGSLVAGAGLIRGALGVFGLTAVLAVCALPFLRLGLRYLLFKAAAALSGIIGGGRLASLLDGIGAACGMILSLVGVEAIFLFISVLSMIKAAGG